MYKQGNPGISGFGGFIRTDDGKWVWGFSGNIGISKNLHTELTALYKGLPYVGLAQGIQTVDLVF